MNRRHRNAAARRRLFSSTAAVVAAAFAGPMGLGVHGKTPEEIAAAGGGGGTGNPFKGLREEFSRLHGEALAVIEGAAKEGRELKDDEKAENDRRFARMDQIKRQTDEYAKFAALTLAGHPDAPADGGVHRPAEIPGRGEHEADRQRHEFKRHAGESDEAFEFRRGRHAVNQYIRTGEAPRHLQFTLTTATGTPAGVMLPNRVGMPIVIKRVGNPVRAALMARGLQVIETDDVNVINPPVLDDSANTADDIAQDSTSENNKDPAVSTLQLGAVLRDSGTVWSSNTLLASLSFDLIAYLEPMLDARIVRRESAAWVASLIAGTVGVTTASTTGVTYAELLTWQHSIPVHLRGDGVFFVSDGLFRAIRGLVDSQGNPIFQESLRDDAPDRLLGWPVFPTDDLAAPAAGVVSGVAASASHLIVRDVRNRRIERYVSVPTHPDQFGIRMFANNDMKFVGTGVRTLKHAAV